MLALGFMHHSQMIDSESLLYRACQSFLQWLSIFMDTGNSVLSFRTIITSTLATGYRAWEICSHFFPRCPGLNSHALVCSLGSRQLGEADNTFQVKS